MFLWNKRKIIFNILICIENDGNGYYAYCPALKGVHVDGETLEEAVENAKIAASLYIASLIKHEDPIPLQVFQKIENQLPRKTEHKKVVSTCHSSQVLQPQYTQVSVNV